ncbi:hypothetical protein RF11_10562 [Thelohanellus kitauei]|uniref:Uncharacterized protein n=1 Tax=Thelohanellus kitauei TaxID=669202 RepID=A0A0C2NKF3_THEKT|nr:hypothetical protein RF11_10562 [Thelohanellus kitauei]
MLSSGYNILCGLIYVVAIICFGLGFYSNNLIALTMNTHKISIGLFYTCVRVRNLESKGVICTPSIVYQKDGNKCLYILGFFCPGEDGNVVPKFKIPLIYLKSRILSQVPSNNRRVVLTDDQTDFDQNLSSSVVEKYNITHISTFYINSGDMSTGFKLLNFAKYHPVALLFSGITYYSVSVGRDAGCEEVPTWIYSNGFGLLFSSLILNLTVMLIDIFLLFTDRKNYGYVA